LLHKGTVVAREDIPSGSTNSFLFSTSSNIFNEVW